MTLHSFSESNIVDEKSIVNFSPEEVIIQVFFVFLFFLLNVHYKNFKTVHPSFLPQSKDT